jgi:hypothetical protein
MEGAAMMTSNHNAHVTDWVKHHARRLSRKPLTDGFKPQALHGYTDADGNPMHWRIRLKNPGTGEKWIRPLMRDGAGFALKQPDYPNGVPLYRLHELAARPDEPVHIVEGETCADALAELSILATTSGAADSAGKADWSILSGRAVTVWPDNDDAGQRYAEAVKNALESVGCDVAMINVAALELEPKDDCVDWLAMHSGAMAADVLALPKIAPRGSTESAPNGAVDTSAPPEPAGETDDAVIASLAALSALDYDRTRTAAAKALAIRPATLDNLVKQGRRDSEAERLPFKEHEPWPEPIDPGTLLSDLSDTIRRFIVLNREQADAVALWVAFTWFIDVVEVAPLAIINAPEKACGKTQLLSVMRGLSCRPLQASNMRPATLFRIAEKWHPAMFIDECDTFIKSDDEMPGLINGGHSRDSSLVWRLVGDSHEPTSFDVWGAKALAGIALEKHLPDSTMSRAVVINMQRKLDGEKVCGLRRDSVSLFDRLASMLARFAADYSDTVRLARPTLPESLSDRTQDNWEPLLSIAGCAGAEWVDRATHAALKLSGVETNSQSAGNELLADIQTIFESKQLDKIRTTVLIAALIEDDETAWATWNRGRPLNPRQLSRMLKAYGINSKTFRDGYETAKGFELSQFKDAFSRYLAPSPEISVTPVTHPENPISTGDSALLLNQSRYPTKTESVTLEPAFLLGCYRVTDKGPVSEGGENTHGNVEVF